MILHADIESRSAADLKLTGVYVYAEHESTEILCVSWRLDAGPITTWYPTTSTRPGQPIPPALRAAFADPAVTIVAHNASFERTMFSGPPGQRLGVPEVSDVARWNCTAARAACAGLPRDLGGAAQAMGLSIAKDTAGALLMRKMCKPRRGGGWHDTPEMHARLGAYCETDVAVESMLDAELPQLTPTETEVWRLTERMNDRGVLIDQALLLDVSFLIEAAEADINRRLSDMTGGAVPRVSDHGALTRWLQVFGLGGDGVGKQALAAMLDRDDLTGLARDVLTLRQEGGKSSAAKYRAMLSRLSGDGRARGALVYCGAGASSRFSSRGIQLQNMPRGGTVKNVGGAIRDLRDGATLAELEEIHGPAMVLASELIRPTIHAPPGAWLARGDYSQIEARVLAWLSGADWKLDAFRAYDAGTGPDLYRIAAAGIYGVPVSEVTKDQRQIGKVGELALGYGGGKGAFLSMAKVYGVTVAEERAEEIKVLWRQANPEVADYATGLWAGLERAALDCAAAPPGRFFPVGVRGVGFRRNGRAMALRMPSGRSLAIWSPRIGLVLTPWGVERPSLLCKSVNPLNNRWEERSIYGGLLCATLTQATARELMAAALIRMQAEGVPAILTVHDEAVAEVPESRFPRPRDAAAEVERIMRQVPKWAAGVPVSADSSAGRRYVKA